MTPMAHDTQTDGTTSEQATTAAAPTGLPYVSVILDADTDDYMVSHTTLLTVEEVLTQFSSFPTASDSSGRKEENWQANFSIKRSEDMSKLSLASHQTTS